MPDRYQGILTELAARLAEGAQLRNIFTSNALREHVEERVWCVGAVTVKSRMLTEWTPAFPPIPGLSNEYCTWRHEVRLAKAKDWRKSGKPFTIFSMHAGEIPVALAWAHPLHGSWRVSARRRSRRSKAGRKFLPPPPSSPLPPAQARRSPNFSSALTGSFAKPCKANCMTARKFFTSRH